MATAELHGVSQPDYRPGLVDVSFKHETGLDPPVLIGALLTGKEAILGYARVLEGEDVPLKPAELLISPFKRGLASFEEMNGRVKEQVAAIAERLQRRVAVVGHSEGGPLAIEAGLNLPESVASVTSWMGPNFGVSKMMPGGHLLKQTVGRIAEGTDDMMADSDYMLDLEEAVATRWPENVALSLVATPFDDLVHMRDALRIKLPPGQRADRRVAVPDNRFTRAAWKHVWHIPNDVGLLATRYPVLHYTVPLHDAPIEHHHEVRSGLAHATQAMVSSAAAVRPHLVAVKS